MRRKIISRNKYFNYHKIRYFGSEYIALDIQSLKQKTAKALNQCQQKRNPTHTAATIDNYNNSKPKSFKPSKTSMTKKTTKLYTLKEVLYLDLYTFCYLTNNKDHFY